jgi:hypothetical protein
MIYDCRETSLTTFVDLVTAENVIMSQLSQPFVIARRFVKKLRINNINITQEKFGK